MALNDSTDFRSVSQIVQERSTTAVPAAVSPVSSPSRPSLDDIVKSLANDTGLPFTTPNLVANRPPQEDVVEGFLPERGVSISFGASGEGKTFVNVDLACALASGQSDWWGLPIKSGPVLWVAGEDYQGTQQRVEAYKQYHGLTDLDLFYLEEPIDFLDRTTMVPIEEAGNLIRQSRLGALRMIVIDMFEVCFPNGDITNEAQLIHAFRNLHWLADTTGAHVRVIDHTGHGNLHRAKGGQTKISRSDAQDRIEADGLKKYVTAVKNRNGTLLPPFGIQFQETSYVALNGTTVSSLVGVQKIQHGPPQASTSSRGTTGNGKRKTGGRRSSPIFDSAYEAFQRSNLMYSYDQLVVLSRDYVSSPNYAYDIAKKIIGHADTVSWGKLFVHTDSVSTAKPKPT